MDTAICLGSLAGVVLICTGCIATLDHALKRAQDEGLVGDDVEHASARLSTLEGLRSCLHRAMDAGS